MEALTRQGFVTQVFCGSILSQAREVDIAAWLDARGFCFEVSGGREWITDALGVRAADPVHYTLMADGVKITLCICVNTRPHAASESERQEFHCLYGAVLDRFRPDVLLTYGGGLLNREVVARAKARKVTTVFAMHSLEYRSSAPFAHVDAVIVPSHFAADHYRQVLGLDCTVLPNLIDLARVVAERGQPHYVTFVNPSPEKGAFPFARIADELGRRRPDIPLLVVEGRGTESTLADCGIDLRLHGNVYLIANTPDPRQFWGVTRICLMPSLWMENQPLVAVEAMANGIPVIGSDRGGIPETLGNAGIVLPLPDRLTASTRVVPAAEEVAPWVEAVIRLWDDRELYAEHRQRAVAESKRWTPDVLIHRYVQFFEFVGRSGGET